MNYIDELSGVLYKKYSRNYNALAVFEKLREDLKEFNEQFELHFKATNNKSSIDFDPEIVKCGDTTVESFDKILVTIDGLERLIVCEVQTDYPGIYVYDPEYGRPCLRIKPDSADSVTVMEFREDKIKAEDLLDFIIGRVFLIPNHY
ncbi:hypothetical protein MOB65_19180 [Bacillus inaquosorum]|uniref:hypothetical protein n=1 Tax=Bacillus inaquosorum TaxID=483913 RepID=UPI00227EFA60|nr:hypothetical protein [Bacillus inaquosorum]MCY7910987.1 hypothetical protein [Bacillus inaquosorum]